MPPRSVMIYASARDCTLIGVFDKGTMQPLDYDYAMIRDPEVRPSNAEFPPEFMERDSEAKRIFWRCAASNAFKRYAQLGPWRGADWSIAPKPAAFELSGNPMGYEQSLLDFDLLTVSLFVPISDPVDRKALSATDLTTGSSDRNPGFLRTHAERKLLLPYAASDEDAFLRMSDSSLCEPSLDARSRLYVRLFKNGRKFALYVEAQLPCSTREQLWFLMALRNAPCDISFLQTWHAAEEFAVLTSHRALDGALKQIKSVKKSKPAVRIEGTIRRRDNKTYVYSNGTSPLQSGAPFRFIEDPTGNRGAINIYAWAATMEAASVPTQLDAWPSKFPSRASNELRAKFTEVYKSVISGDAEVWKQDYSSEHNPS